MDSFSWTDGIRAAVGACLPCFASTQRGRPSDDPTQSENEGRTSRAHQSHYDELEGLLGDVDDTDADAETMSLHSNVGDGRSRIRRKKNRKRRGPVKTIRLFGFNLFGRPPVQLSESEHEDDGDSDLVARRRGLGRLRAAHSSSSISAFDSDASPLDASLIAQLSAEDAAARAVHEAMLHAAEEQRRREEREEKEERRRRRRERRELKKVAQELARGVNKNGDPEDFEGFQGSGQLRPSLGTDPAAGSGSGTASVASPLVAPTTYTDEFGPFVAGTKPFAGADDELPDGETDFGGEAYARTTRSRGSDSSRSHTQSQTSTSQTQSNVGSSHHAHNYNQHYGSPLSSPSVSNPGIGLQSPNITSPFPGAPSPLNLMGVPRRNKHSKRSSASQSTGKKSSNSPTSPSASLPSFDSVPTAFAPAEPHIVEHEHDSESGAGVLPVSPSALPFSFEKGLQSAAKFPSAGFGGVRRTNSSGSGVFLARRGDD
ncbi:hypothetical protein M0805_002782 [Coniferiporia weirii]|nr:hypothetical protein M0805_002782 [Coniferiporia weirii]